MKVNKWLDILYYPPEFKFDTAYCPILKKKGRISINNFEAAGAAVYRGFARPDVKVLMGRDSANFYALIESKTEGKLRTLWRKDAPWLDDTHELMIDPSHDHQNFLQFIVNAKNKRVSYKIWNAPGNIRLEHKKESEPNKLSWSSETTLRGRVWKTLYKIPFSSLGKKLGSDVPVFGMMPMDHRASGEHTGIPGYFREREIHAPWAYMDVAAENRTLVVEKVSLGETKLLVDNLLTLSGVNKTAASSFLMKVTVYTGKDEVKYFENLRSFNVAPGKKFEESIMYRFDHLDWEYHAVKVEVTGSDGKKYYTATYKVSYLHGMMLAYGRPEGKCENPDPKDPDFVDKKFKFILSRIPEFYRPDNLPFVIRSLDNKVTFDLMKKGVMKKIADYVYGLFDNDMDRLAGATLLLNRHGFIIYVNQLACIEGDLNPLSTLRWRYEQCGSSATVLLGLIEKLRMNKSRKCFTGHIVGMNNHVITLVHYKGKHVPLDPSVGKLFFSYDNKGYASYEELVKDAKLVSKSGDKYVRLFQRDPEVHFKYDYGKFIWPAGAVAE